MIPLLALLASALAAAPGGWDVSGGVPVRMVGVKLAALTDGQRLYTQGALRADVAFGAWSAFAEVPVLAGTGASGWSDAAPGNLWVGVRYQLGRDPFRSALAIELRRHLGARSPGFWVMGSRDTYGNTVGVAWEFSVMPRAPLSGRVSLSFGYTGGDSLLSGTGIELAKVFPVAPRWAVVAEAALVADATPFSLRALARWDPSPHWSVDAGVNLPVELMFVHPVFMPVLQVRSFW